jgi:TMEM175 potassium channel family protein
VKTQRLETFADGVFAIAATLLILDVRPEGSGGLGDQLLHAWPQYAAYAISFVTIGIIWANHHEMFGEIERVNRPFLLLNVFFLMMVAFIPFPTKLDRRDAAGRGLAARRHRRLRSDHARVRGRERALRLVP